MQTPVSLRYDENVNIELDLCISPDQGRNFQLETAVIGVTGTYTHFVCDRLPCGPDTPGLLASESSPFPVGTTTANLGTYPDKVYVTVHGKGGEYNSTEKAYIGQFSLGGQLTHS